METKTDQSSYVKTKFFIPQTTNSLITRRRLFAQLDAARHKRLILVTAPAGFGKTTLITQWLRAALTPSDAAVWVSLDEHDNSVVKFWGYIAAGLAHSSAAFALKFAEKSDEKMDGAHDTIFAPILNTLAELNQPVFLILDDLHRLDEPAIFYSLSHFIERLPAHVHIILLSRTLPALPIARLRLAQQIVEINIRQLCCTRAEVEGYFAQVIRRPLPSEVINELMARTEGWFIGLRLFGLLLQEGADPAALIADLQGSNRYISDYLIEEVLHTQSPAMREFLLHISVLDDFSASLCAAITGREDSQHLLEQIEQANLFIIALDERREWFRFHTLFAEALRHRFWQSQPQAYQENCRRASAYYASLNQVEETVDYALRGQDWEYAADVLEELIKADLWYRPDAVIIYNWVRQLPEPVIASRLYLCFYISIQFFSGSPIQDAQRWMQRAEALAHALPDDDPRKRLLLGHTYVYQAIMHIFYHLDYATSAHVIEKARRYVTPQDGYLHATVFAAEGLELDSQGYILRGFEQKIQAKQIFRTIPGWDSTIMDYSTIGYRLLMHGYLKQTEMFFEQSDTRMYQRLHPELAIAAVVYAELLREKNQLDKALELAVEGLRLLRQIDGRVHLDRAYHVLARIHLSRGSVSAASAFSGQLIALDATGRGALRLATNIIDSVRVWIASGDIQRARQWMRGIQRQPRHSSPQMHIREDIACAYIYLADEQFADAIVLLKALAEALPAYELLGEQVEVHTLLALAHQQGGDKSAALAALGQALRLAEPQGYIRRFLDAGDGMHHLLRDYRQSKREPRAYVEQLLDAAEAETRSKGMNDIRLAEALNAREREILRLISAGASNQQIAEKLSLALNTVKRYTSNIFSKLNVPNRTSAVAEARRLGLFD